MPTKKPTNKLSQMYKNIDQKELSQEAKDTLTKLRLATANFAKKEGKEADAFILFYNRLVSKKPTAVKTTKEYKDMKTERRRETGRKAMEARKAKQESRQGQGSERDAARPAKPFGWRLKGKHNYRKPTRADISSGKAYYEARINRADSKRTKFPMLERGGSLDGKYVIYYKEFENGKLVVEKHKEFNSYLSAKRELNKLASNQEHSYMLTDMETFMDMYGDRFEYGGYMANGGGVSTKYAIVDENTDRIYFKSTDKKLVELKFKEFKEIYPNVNLSIIEFPNQYANGGEVDKGGMIYALRNEISGGTIANKSGVDSYDDIAKVRRMAIQYYMENGDAPYSLGELDRVLALVGEEMGTTMAKGGEIGDNGIITDKNSFFTGKMGLIVGELDPKTWLVRVGDRTVVVPKKGIDIVSSDDEYAEGGELKNAIYVSSRDIQKISLKLDGKNMEISGNDILDGVYLKKYPKNENVENRRVLKFSDTVLYKDQMYEFIKKDGDVGFKKRSSGASGLDGSFISLRKFSKSDLEENLTDMMGRKFYIPPYEELVKMPYGFAKGGSMNHGGYMANSGVFYKESHKLGHE